MLFADIALSKRLESAEGHAGAQYAAARRRVFPESGAEWMRAGGAYIIFDGVDSPVTQTFGLGLFEDLTAASLETIERFFLDRDAPVLHEVSHFAGVAALQLLSARGYRPHEISSVLYRSVEEAAVQRPGNISVRVAGPEQAQCWADISARGWSHEHPEFHEFLQDAAAISTARVDSPCFLAEIDGEPGAAGVLCMHAGVALFGGSSTVPELRRRGLQAALLSARMRYALEHGCDLAMIVAEAGSNSQRNAERHGFRVAYTRIKWRLNRAGTY